MNAFDNPIPYLIDFGIAYLKILGIFIVLYLPIIVITVICKVVLFNLKGRKQNGTRNH